MEIFRDTQARMKYTNPKTASAPNAALTGRRNLPRVKVFISSSRGVFKLNQNEEKKDNPVGERYWTHRNIQESLKFAAV